MGRLWIRWPRRVVVMAVVALGAALGVAACSEGDGDDGDAAATSERAGTLDSDCTEARALDCAPDGTTLDAYLPETPTAATGEPLTIGMINQDTGPAGAFPELTLAVEAGIEFINTELDGVDGRPIELVSCDTEFSPAGSQQCAQQMVQEGAVAVLGGIDVYGDGIEVLEANGIAYVGGIPVSFQSAQSPVSFQFSGGSWGAVLGFADYSIEELDVEKVSIMYGDFGSIKDAADYGRRALEAAGVEVKMVPFPIITTDYLTPLTAAAEGDPDAIYLLAADTGCVPSLEGSVDLQITARMFFVGACLSPNILESAGDEATEGKIFNTEQQASDGGEATTPDTGLYADVIEIYGDGLDPATAGTVSFRSLMNLYAQLREAGAASVTPAALLERFDRAQDQPSFSGYPYTCDGSQIPALPSLCAPEQVLAERRDGRLEQLTDWIDVSQLVQ